MGHERLGSVPTTAKWENIVEFLNGYRGEGNEIETIANRTLENVSDRFDRIESDPGVSAAFRYLTALSVASRHEDMKEVLSEHGLEIPEEPTPLSFAISVRRWVQEQEDASREYSEIACEAATDAVTEWHERKKGQGKLFEVLESEREVWREAGDGGGFSELARSFFANFTERYLNYFLEREASASIEDFDNRERFQEQVSRHAYQRAKITQSFAAGWFNNHAKEDFPSEGEVKNFLRTAFGKIREGVSREVEE